MDNQQRPFPPSAGVGIGFLSEGYYLSLFTNGTLPLITALQALRISGEVITTPYSFVATTHALWWNGIKPVFVDIDPSTGNIDPDKIESCHHPQDNRHHAYSMCTGSLAIPKGFRR